MIVEAHFAQGDDAGAGREGPEFSEVVGGDFVGMVGVDTDYGKDLGVRLCKFHRASTSLKSRADGEDPVDTGLGSSFEDL